MDRRVTPSTTRFRPSQALVIALGAMMLAAEPGAAAARPPSILLLYSDQHNAGVLGCAGHPDVSTPRLDRLAAEGARFNRAYCQDAVCVPSRTCLMTGHYARTTGMLGNSGNRPALGRFRPLARLLQENGYRTAAFGKRHLPPALDVGFDVACSHLEKEPSQEHYREWVAQRGELEAFDRDWRAEFGHSLPGNQAEPMANHVSALRPEDTMEAYTAAKTIEFLREMKGRNQPFFCWASFYRPHQPYTPVRLYADRYDLSKLTLPGSLREPCEHLPPLLMAQRRSEAKPWCLALAAKDESLYRRYIGSYYALVSEIDHHIGAILDVLEQEGLAEGTIVVYTSDHGDFVGGHGMVEKCATGHNVYEETLRVPLIVRWPSRVRAGVLSEDLVESVDLYPTLLDLAGIKPPGGEPLPGRVLRPVLAEGRSLGRDVAISENRAQLTAVGPRYKLGVWLERPGDYPDMLFDRQRDPLEMQNLIGRPEVAEAERQLRAAIRTFVERTPSAPPDTVERRGRGGWPTASQPAQRQPERGPVPPLPAGHR